MTDFLQELEDAAEQINQLARESGWNVCHEAKATIEQLQEEVERFAVWNKGMTLHDYFAAKAMAAFIDIQEYGSGNIDYSNIAKDAYLLADAMVKTKAER